MTADTKPAREPLLPCPLCGPGATGVYSEADIHSGFVRCSACNLVMCCNTEAEVIAAWNRRITREPAAPVGDDALADAVKWARDLVARERADDVSRIFPDADLRHLHTLANAAERAPKGSVILPPEQVRKIAALVPRWREVAKRHYAEAERCPAGSSLYEGCKALGIVRDNCANTLEADLLAAGIIGGEHG